MGIMYDDDEDDDDILEIARMVEESESRAKYKNTEKIEAIKEAFYRLRDSMSEIDASVTCELHTPYPSMGGIIINGKEFEIEDMEALINVLKLASNVEVYPKTDGTVQLDITFHGLTRNE